MGTRSQARSRGNTFPAHGNPFHARGQFNRSILWKGVRKTDAAGVIDTHVFAFSPAFLEESRLPRGLDGTFDTLREDMDAAGVARAIATVFVTRQDDFFESVARGLERHRPGIAVQLNIAPNEPEWAAANLRRAAADRDVAGARAALSLFRMAPSDEQLAPVWDACEKGRLPVQVVVDGSKYASPEGFTCVARERPGLALVLSVSRAGHRAGFKALTRYDSVYFQVPGLLDTEAASGEPVFLRWAARNLPPERLLFGSDRLGRERDYAAKVRAVRSLEPGVRAWVTRDAARALYGARLPSWRA